MKNNSKDKLKIKQLTKKKRRKFYLKWKDHGNCFNS